MALCPDPAPGAGDPLSGSNTRLGGTTMANGVRSFVVVGATAILMGASMLGGQGSATAGTPQAAKVVAESKVITGQLGDAQNKRHCRWIWHRGYWQWVPRRYW